MVFDDMFVEYNISDTFPHGTGFDSESHTLYTFVETFMCSDEKILF